MDFGIDDFLPASSPRSKGWIYWLTIGIVVYLLYLGAAIHRYNYLSVRNPIRTLVAKKMHYVIIFPRAQQC